MSKTIARRDLCNRSSDILCQVEDGESFESTDHGEVVAALVPAQTLPLRGLRLRPAITRGAFSTLPRHRVAVPSEQVLDALCGDR